MQLCTAHLNKLYQSLEEHGLGHLGSKTPEGRVRALLTEWEGRGAENDFDPFVGAHNMIWKKGLELFGERILDMDGPRDYDGHHCPICTAVGAYDAAWIDIPVETMLAIAREKGIVP